MILYDPYCCKYELNGLYTVTFCVIFQFLTMFNTYHCRSQSCRSRTALRLRLRPNDAAPCGSATLLFRANFPPKKFREEIRPKIYLGHDPDPDRTFSKCGSRSGLKSFIKTRIWSRIRPKRSGSDQKFVG
jgi:hypothetical protein